MSDHPIYPVPQQFSGVGPSRLLFALPPTLPVQFVQAPRVAPDNPIPDRPRIIKGFGLPPALNPVIFVKPVLQPDPITVALPQIRRIRFPDKPPVPLTIIMPQALALPVQGTAPGITSGAGAPAQTTFEIYIPTFRRRRR